MEGINWYGKYACMLSSICVFNDFVWTGENDLKTLRVDANIFENGEEKLRFQTKTNTCNLSFLLFTK